MDRTTNRACQLANQLTNYRAQRLPHWDEFDNDVIARLNLLLRNPNPTQLPIHDNPYPPDWPISRPTLNKPVKDFIRLTSQLTSDPDFAPVGTDSPPQAPLGRPRQSRSRSVSITNTPELAT
ncbi:hypothetical protein N7465_008619 [Penicillium sp. CMV-2018d]|nr:hypothetical protein N7465_008619 [Penicillium sp. CMV-2018d]